MSVTASVCFRSIKLGEVSYDSAPSTPQHRDKLVNGMGGPGGGGRARIERGGSVDGDTRRVSVDYSHYRRVSVDMDRKEELALAKAVRKSSVKIRRCRNRFAIFASDQKPSCVSYFKILAQYVGQWGHHAQE